MPSTFTPGYSVADRAPLRSATAALTSRLPAVAAVRSLDKLALNRPALIRAALRVNGETIAPSATTPVVRRFSTGDLVIYTSGTTLGATEPALTYLAAITDGNATGYALGRISAPVPAGVTVPTVTPSTGNTGKVQFFNFATNADKFLQATTPNVVTVGANNYGYLYDNGGSGTIVSGVRGAAGQKRTIEWLTDAPEVDFVFMPSNSGYVERPRFFVDDYPLEEVPSPFAGSVGSTQKYTVTYPGAGVRRWRVEISPGVNLRGIGVDAGYTVSAPMRRGLTAVLRSDSFGNTTTPQPAYAPGEFLAEQFARALGIRYLLNFTEGGTGYVKEGPTVGRRNALWVTQNNDLSATPVDVVILWQGFNDSDGSVDLGELKKAATALWTETRKQHPEAVILVFGPWSSAKSGIQAYRNADLAIQEAFVAFDDHRSEFCSVMTGARISGLWGAAGGTRGLSTGSGYVGNTTGVGNSDYITSTDSAHPSPMGQIEHLKWLTAQAEDMLSCQGL